MNQPLVEAPTYFNLNEEADKFIVKIKQLSPKAKVIVIIEDEINSIIKQTLEMVMSDSLGLLHLSLIRLDQFERQSFVDRQQASKQLEQNREIFINDQTEKGKLN